MSFRVIKVSAVAIVAALYAERAGAQTALPTIDVGKKVHATKIGTPRPQKPSMPATRPPERAPVVVAHTNTGGAAPSWIPAGEQLWRGPTNVNGYFAGGTSTATKTNTKILDIPQSVTIITQQQLQDRNSLTLNQALSYTPGVTVTQGEGNTDAITIRGQATTSNFYTDNVRDDAKSYRDLYATESVEVLKGPSAIIFGRGGGGGIVNRVTKKADGVERKMFRSAPAASAVSASLSMSASQSAIRSLTVSMVSTKIPTTGVINSGWSATAFHRPSP